MAFQEELIDLLNRHSVENESDTPDFILAQVLLGCLKVWNDAVLKRDAWYGFRPWGTSPWKGKQLSKQNRRRMMAKHQIRKLHP